MKFFYLIVVTVLLATALGQTWVGIGNRVPGETLLGFTQNSSSVTQTPQNHTVHLFRQGYFGENITFVHVNIDPRYTQLSFPTLGQFYDFWVDILLTNTTFLTANMYVYGFRPTAFEPKMVTLYGDSN